MTVETERINQTRSDTSPVRPMTGPARTVVPAPGTVPGQVGLLAAVILAVEVLVVGTHVALASRARRALRDPKVVRRTNRVAGGLMVGAGLAVVATR
jgi:threonine/homoserine/homoserine lactone efflux protein